MNYKFHLIILSIFTLISCKTEGVKKESNEDKDTEITHRVDSLELNLPVKEVLKLDNGIEITWIEKTNGEKIKAGEVVMIDYKVRLVDSTIIDGNHLLNKKTLPFIVGFGFQPKGWDIAFSHLSIGDFVKIKLPSEFARGNKGVKNLIPENADNYLTVRIISKRKPDREIDGNKVWVLEENKTNKVLFDENHTIEFHTSISSPSSPFYYNSFAKNQPFELKLEDQGTIPGLKKALINAKKGDRLFIYVPSKEAYGTKGYVDLVKPNEDLFYNLLVMDVYK